MIKVYIGELCSGYSQHPVLYPNLGRVRKESRLFLDKAFDVLKEPLVEVVQNPKEADFLMLPHEYFVIEQERAYINQYVRLAQELDREILIFDWSDLDQAIDIPHSIVFRVSQYKSKMKNNVIVMPPFAPDLPPALPRHKSEKPSVGFMGYAGHGTFFQTVKGGIKDMLRSGAHKSGIYWRRRSMKILRKDIRLKTNFVIRTFFSGHRDTIGIMPEDARREYIKNITDSDFVLAPKGDGNASIRFYETLALGRVPILIDTDCLLPLEKEINYDDFIVRITWQELENLPERIVSFYANLTDESFRLMQIKALETFSQYLRIDKFFKHEFGRLEKQNHK